MKKRSFVLVVLIGAVLIGCRTTGLNQSADTLKKNQSEVNGNLNFSMGGTYGVGFLMIQPATLIRSGISDHVEYQSNISLLYIMTLLTGTHLLTERGHEIVLEYEGAFKFKLYDVEKNRLSLVTGIGLDTKFLGYNSLFTAGFSTSIKVIGDYRLSDKTVFYFGPYFKLQTAILTVRENFFIKDDYIVYTYPDSARMSEFGYFTFGFSWGWDSMLVNTVLRNEVSLGASLVLTRGPVIYTGYTISIGKRN